ncbi:MAG: hypothetical protein ACFCGT_26240 [Sandaracinaceae bacterium]
MVERRAAGGRRGRRGAEHGAGVALAVLLGALGCTDAPVPCASNPTAPGCQDPIWVCCVDPTVDGCDPTPEELAELCQGGGEDMGLVDAGPCGMPCEGETPVCDPDRNRCVQCTEDDDSACVDGTPICDTTNRVCVECAADTDCTDPSAARCDGGECVPCDSSTQCQGIAGREVCDDDAGECVQCTGGEVDACGGNPCTTESTCSAFGTDRITCEACDTDANCGLPDELCVPMQFMGEDRPGGYCLRNLAAGCDRPFGVVTGERTTLSGVGGISFCGINESLTTCEAVRALLADEMCPGGDDSECPDGGLCRRVGGFLNRCTFACTVQSECLNPPVAGSTCGGDPDPTYCGG